MHGFLLPELDAEALPIPGVWPMSESPIVRQLVLFGRELGPGDIAGSFFDTMVQIANRDRAAKGLPPLTKSVDKEEKVAGVPPLTKSVDKRAAGVRPTRDFASFKKAANQQLADDLVSIGHDHDSARKFAGTPGREGLVRIEKQIEWGGNLHSWHFWVKPDDAQTLVSEGKATIATQEGKPVTREGVPYTPAVPISKGKHVVRPSGFESTGDEGEAFLDSVTRDDRAYRGMTASEYNATIGAGKPLQSTNKYSLPGEGTNFSHDAADAESYVNFGRDDPRRGDKATYLVEVHKADLDPKRDGYLESQGPVPLDQVTRVWRMTSDTPVPPSHAEARKLGRLPESAGSIVAEQIPVGPVVTRTWEDTIPGMPAHTLDANTVDGQLTPERKIIHERLIAKRLDGVKPVPPGQKPVVIITMGGPGAGKSSSLTGMPDEKTFVRVDPDSIREELPEWKELTDPSLTARNAGSVTHREASQIAGEVRTRAIQERKNLVLDASGYNLEIMKAQIADLQKAGYHVHMLGVHMDVDQASRGNFTRGQIIGRRVQEGLLREYHRVCSSNLLALSEVADTASIVETGIKDPTINRPMARLVFAKDADGSTRDVDTGFMEQFRSKWVAPRSPFPDERWTELSNLTASSPKPDHPILLEHWQKLQSMVESGEEPS